jgi:hypothetical protein
MWGGFSSIRLVVPKTAVIFWSGTLKQKNARIGIITHVPSIKPTWLSTSMTTSSRMLTNSLLLNGRRQKNATTKFDPMGPWHLLSRRIQHGPFSFGKICDYYWIIGKIKYSHYYCYSINNDVIYFQELYIIAGE